MDFDFHALRRTIRASQAEVDSEGEGEEGEREGAIADWSSFLRLDQVPFAMGGFGDVYRANWANLPSGASKPPPIVVKAFRFPGGGTESKMVTKRSKMFAREGKLWSKLNHKNIVPFIGTVNLPGRYVLGLASVYMAHGTLRDYLPRHPNIDRLGVCLEVANGLNYLHSFEPPIVHGDMKANNVLVDSNGIPRISDFGLSSVAENQELWHTSITTLGGTLRWTSPELINGETMTATAAADVYAFGMTCLEIATLEVPYSKYPRDIAVLAAVVIRRELPERPSIEFVTDNLWQLWESCWKTEPFERPYMHDVVRELLMLMNGEPTPRSIRQENHLRRFSFEEVLSLNDNKAPPALDYIISLPVLDGYPLFQAEMIAGRIGWNEVNSFQAETAVKVMDILQKIIDNASKEESVSIECRRCIIGLHRRTGLIPSSIFLSGIQTLGSEPEYDGTFGQIWKGDLNGREVALKVSRISGSLTPRELENIKRAFHKEVVIWKQLHHPNILPCLGLSTDRFPRRLCIVSPYISFGNVLRYIKARVEAGLSCDRRKLILDAVSGLCFLHSFNPALLHGDIKGANMLVDDDGRLVLCDFGLATYAEIQSMNNTSLTGSGISGTLRWTAYELIKSNRQIKRKSRATDIFALGMTIIEIYSVEKPYHDEEDGSVSLLLMKERPPTRVRGRINQWSEDITDEMWSIARRCLHRNPLKRPSADNLLAQLQSVPVERQAMRWMQSSILTVLGLMILMLAVLLRNRGISLPSVRIFGGDTKKMS